MLKVGLTGNFYSGYNEAAEMFESNGIPVFDADLIIKFMVNYSEKVIKKIKNKFGDDIYFLGLLDTKKFESNKDFEKLFEVIELNLLKAYEKWRIKHWDKPYTIFKCSILFERKLSSSMNYCISVFKPQIERKKDIQNLTKIPQLTIDTIISNEMDELTKNQKSDFVIHNYASYFRDSINMGFKRQIDMIDKSLNKKTNSNYSNLSTLSTNQEINNIFT
jgi:dephospho-CoA kinase